MRHNINVVFGKFSLPLKQIYKEIHSIVRKINTRQFPVIRYVTNCVESILKRKNFGILLYMKVLKLLCYYCER